MADPTPIPAVTPAPVPVSPAVAQRFAEPDMLYRGNIYGKEQIVPIKVLAEGWQSKEAGKMAIAEANRMKAELHLDSEHAARWRRLESQLTNPSTREQAFADLERLAGVTRAASFDPSDPRSAQAADDPKTRVLDERLRRIEEGQNQIALKARINETLDHFDVFKQDPELRSDAETQILAMQVVNPASDPMEIATRIYNRELTRGSASATQQRDQRQAAQKAMPLVPAGLGMPDLTDIPQGKAGDTRDGGPDGMTTFKRNFMEAARRFTQAARGNV